MNADAIRAMIDRALEAKKESELASAALERHEQADHQAPSVSGAYTTVEAFIKRHNARAAFHAKQARLESQASEAQSIASAAARELAKALGLHPGEVVRFQLADGSFVKIRKALSTPQAWLDIENGPTDKDFDNANLDLHFY